jgi:hypothetical protein
LSKPTGHAICPFSGIKITPRTRHTHAERVSNESPTPRPGLSAFTTVGDALFRMREPTCCATHPCAAVKETPRTRHTHAEREATETSLLRCRQRELNITQRAIFTLSCQQQATESPNPHKKLAQCMVAGVNDNARGAASEEPPKLAHGANRIEIVPRSVEIEATTPRK